MHRTLDPRLDRLPAPTRRVDAVDGLRGLALLGMLAWHAQVSWVKGGFARMTIFFALSGFLAATSYLSLQRRQTPRPFVTFWRRRARRLLPISVLGVGLATLVTVSVRSESGLATLRGDALSVLAHASNWRFIANEQSYGSLFERPSAFQHFWSLSLEEQCFWLLPLVLAGVGVTRRRSWLVVAGLAAALAAIPAVVSHSPDVAYYGTHVRAGEFLAGVALALVLARSEGRVPEAARPAVRVLGALSLVGLLAVMVLVDRNGAWLYQGGLGLFALPAVAVIAATLDDRGLVPAVLSRRPLVALGRWAFPIYVLHWPVFLWLGARTDLTGTRLVLVELAVSIALGAAVHRWVEQPLLSGGRIGWRRDGVVLSGALAVGAVVALFAVNVPVPAPTYDFVAMEHAANTAPPEAEQVGVGPIHPSVPTVALFGGSTAVSLGGPGWQWAEGQQALRLVSGDSRLGCGLLTEGVRVFGRSPEGERIYDHPDDHCLDWRTRWPAAATGNDVDVAVLFTGVWDTADWMFDDDGVWRSIGDPLFDELVRTRLLEAIDLLADQGVLVVLATTPEVGPGEHGTAREDRFLGPDHPGRVAAYNQMLRDAAALDGRAVVLEYGAYVDALGPARSAQYLPDGIHATEPAALTIWSEYLGPALGQVIDAAKYRPVLPVPPLVGIELRPTGVPVAPVDVGFDGPVPSADADVHTDVSS